MKRLLLAFAFSLVGFRATADDEIDPTPMVFSPEYGSDVFFTMVPEKYVQDHKIEKAAFGVAYQLKPDGVIKELYRTEGWYSFSIFISNDGRYLVRKGPWNKGMSPSKDDLAVAFYKDGKLLKEYSTEELIHDTDKVVASSSHYRWLAPSALDRDLTDADYYRLRLHLDSDNIFHLHTIDGWTYLFDATTGQIKSQEKTGK